MDSYLDRLRALPVKKVQEFLASKRTDGIPPELAAYITELNDAANLLKEYPDVAGCAHELMKLHPHISLTAARNRVCDSISYFNTGCTVTADEWNLYFADAMMELYKEARKDKDIKEARLCLERAREFRVAAASQAVNPNLIKYKEQLISPDVELDRMGVKKSGMFAAYRRAMEIIEARDASATDKERLKRELSTELGVEDVESQPV